MHRTVLVVSLLSAFPLFAVISYPPPTYVTTGLGPTAIAVADFNGDCAPDFATADQFISGVTVAFGNGAGGFPTTTAYTGFAAPQSIVSADFDNDGAPDLAVGNSVTYPGDTVGFTVSILLNNGSGGFTAGTPLATSGNARWLATADVDEDGNADLFVSDILGSPYGIRLYTGNGDGTFDAPSVIGTDTRAPGAMVLVDLNGDGDLDLATSMGDATGIFLGNGNGTFGAPSLLLYPDPINGADGACHIAAADIDHDGDVDLATVAGNALGGATVFRNNGNATFTRSQFKMPLNPTNPIFVALADLDGDGNIDIVSANQYGCTPEGSNLSARPGNGDGTFGASQPISVGYGPTCVNSHWQPNAIAAFDMNCDGAADMVVPNLNTSFCSVLLTPGGVDTTAPSITAPANLTVPASGPGCTAVVSDAQLGNATATDNCSRCVVITRSGVPAGNVFPAGTTTITYTANDGHGNSASATQTVTVTDSVAPSITAPADISVTAGAGCVASLDPGTPAASDNCSSVTVTGVRSDGLALNAPYPVGVTTITWTATDANLNSASDTQTITVSAPPLTISGGTASPSSLWPPNHRLVSVALSYSATGGCGAIDCSIASATSNEPDNGLGDGDAANDIQIVDATHVLLRAERSGTGAGRVYTITVTCTDGEHTATKTILVTVPKSK